MDARDRKKGNRREDVEGETPKLPPELQKALDRFIEENRGVFEALARL